MAISIEKLAELGSKPQCRYLEPKPYNQTRQLGIVGRNMTVWDLAAEVVVSERSPEEVAKDFRLPLEAVLEAVDYYYRNQAMIDAETNETGRRLGLK